ncbi:MAG: hypothetical protein AVDCRST_MAG83-3799 [uncultured Arthrobacter sp.]|uniref:Uncharacterized protein n=1 Tax=uncultured Arthrobacter sp. TaxID=114050 RepID=A0A6J4JD45_9MICC|nr:hypothetical protein [uncultured Arthrobacter sp.]CAA9277131.1 MAG: hypothetical protein AVDCRST_MAG83-3799 [uncultured Arthrobacter sp.]
MDLLGGISLDVLRILPWIAAIVFALAAGFWRPRKLHWTALSSVLLFAALNAGAAIYVLNSFNDPRWSSGKDPSLSTPSLSDTPIVGEYLGDLDSALEDVVGGVNEFLAFKQALPVALDFLAASGWALLASFPLAILAAGIGFTMARRRTAAFDRYRADVDLLKEELEQLKRQISSGHSGSTALPSGHADSEVLPRRTRS